MVKKKVKMKKKTPLEKAEGILEQQDLEDGSTVLSLIESDAYKTPVELERSVKEKANSRTPNSMDMFGMDEIKKQVMAKAGEGMAKGMAVNMDKPKEEVKPRLKKKVVKKKSY